MAVTSFDAILGMAPTQPEELTLSGWSPDTEITVLVKKPNFYNLLAKNAIPNPLLPEMQKLFVRRQVAEEHSKASADFAKALIHIARECLVEPAYTQLEEAGVELTDDQLLELCMYATLGPEVLRSFRESARDRAGKHGKAVPPAAEPDPAPERPADGVVRGRSDHAGNHGAAKRREAAAQKDGR